MSDLTISNYLVYHKKDERKKLATIGGSRGITISKKKIENVYETDTFDIHYLQDAIVLLPVEKEKEIHEDGDHNIKTYFPDDKIPDDTKEVPYGEELEVMVNSDVTYDIPEEAKEFPKVPKKLEEEWKEWS